MKKIIVSVTNDLSTDQRVAKVCDTLHKSGFDILLVGRKLTTSLPVNRNYTTKRLNLLFNKGFLFYAEYNTRLFFLLLFSKKDILLANDLDTLLPNFIISKLQGKKLVFDSHELFSEIPELAHKKRVQWFWKKLETLLIPEVKNGITVCESIAEYYKKLYNGDFIVVRNLPLKQKNNSLKKNLNFNKKIILYQGSVNIGRGLELMIDTIKFLDDFLFLIVGDGDITQQLKKIVQIKKLENKVIFYGKVNPEELKNITPNAVLGISLEEDLGLNYRFTLPNKIFDYIQAEVPILVSNLPEMKQIILDYKVGEITTNRTPKDIAYQIQNITQKDFSDALKRAKSELIWENEEQILLSIFSSL
ncbi:glycosyltransferase [Tenacibaculum sp. IB213877]|uniref:glycosyltransferase n=1 Tax=Tenacibaculum sp. IB213877 TaxID=3097351 RepID=UPI002A5A6E03|nr:glycosyltransferase [Tenacibaculum sp. IB213877]MDY0780182.1 glycosyltransferase [Tenacibaculum sp. IB213877]